MRCARPSKWLWLALSLVFVAGFSPRIATAAEKADGPGEPSYDESLVRQALEAVVAGSRDAGKLAQQAIERAPDFAPARWLRGEVQVDGKWLSAADVAKQAAADTRLAEYRQVRATKKETAADQLALGKWCRDRGLEDEARAHFTRVLELNSGNAEALAALDLREHNGRLLTWAQIKAEAKADRDAAAALKKYKPTLLAARRLLDSQDDEKRAAGRQQLHSITDPAAVKAMEAAFEKASQRACRVWISHLQSLPHQEAADSLVRQAVGHAQQPIRDAALTALRGRPQQSYVPALLSGLQMPLEKSYEVVTDAQGVRFRHTVKQEGETRDKVVTHEARVTLQVPNPFISFFIREVGAQARQESNATDSAIKKANDAATAANQKFFYALEKTTGADVHNDPRSWWSWWHDENDVYSSGSRSADEKVHQYDHNVPYQVQQVQRYAIASLVSSSGAPVTPHECFPAGTTVWTLTGQMPIEQVHAGDRVLSQDPLTGELAYKPVLKRTFRPIRTLVQIDLGDERISATRGHLFWVLGQGWLMAKELKPGMRLHSPGGNATVQAVSEVEPDNVYNLIVADYSSFFVGDARVLVHDNTLRKSTTTLVPGLVRQ